MTKTQALEKIKKLLAFDRSDSSENERLLAIKRASELMVKYNLNPEDVKAENPETIASVSYYMPTFLREAVPKTTQDYCFAWGLCISSLSKLFSCAAYSSQAEFRSNQIFSSLGIPWSDVVVKEPFFLVIYGYPNNLEVVQYTLDQIHNKLLLTLREEFTFQDSSTDIFVKFKLRDYLLGFLTGLNAKLMAIKKERDNIPDCVAVEKAVISKIEEQIGSSGSVPSSDLIIRDQEAASAGLEKGFKTDLHSGVANRKELLR